MSTLNDLINRTESPPVVAGMTVEELCRVVGNERRRSVIQGLGTDPVSITRLADVVAEAEHGRGFTAAQRKSVYVAVYQTHLPVLRAHGIAVGPDERLQPGPNHAAVLDCIEELDQRVDGGPG